MLFEVADPMIKAALLSALFERPSRNFEEGGNDRHDRAR